MGMVTRINEREPEVQGGRTINTVAYRVQQFRLQQMLGAISLMQIGMVECKSNNTSNSISARDARNLKRATEDIRREWDLAKQHRDDPSGLHEMVFKISVLAPEEISAMRNVKLRKVAWELYNLFQVVIGSQDASQHVWLGDATEEDIEQAMQTVEKIVEQFIGDGQPTEGGGFNTGVTTANFAYLGHLVPDPTTPQVEKTEPSSDAPHRVSPAEPRPSITERSSQPGGQA